MPRFLKRNKIAKNADISIYLVGNMWQHVFVAELKLYRVGVTVDNIVRYKVFFFTELQHSLIFLSG